MSEVVEIDDIELPEGWQIAELAELAINPKDDIVDGPFGSNLKASEYTETGVPIVRLQNIKRNYFLDKNIKYVTPEKAEQLARHSFKPGDLLITKLGAPLGVACIAPHSIGEGIIVADLVRARLPEDQVDTKYVTYLINSPAVIQEFKENTKGTTRPRVNLKFMRSLRLPIAPYEQQKRIVAKIEELFSHIDAGIEALKKAKQLLKQYRQSVLKAAVTGELTKEWRAAQGRASVAGGRTPGATEAESKGLEPASQLLERILKERREKWEQQQLEQFKAKGKKPKDDKWKEKYKEPVELELDVEDSNLPNEWVTASLDMFGELYCGQSPSVSQVNTEGKGVLYVTGPEQWNGKDIEERKWTEHPKRLVPDGCIFITVKGAGVGKLFPGVACAIGRDVYAYKPHDELDVRYVINVLQYGINLVIAKAQGDIPGLSRNHIMEHAVGLPSIEEQNIICDSLEEKVTEIDRLEHSINEQLIKSEKNKQSILSSVFAGGIQ